MKISNVWHAQTIRMNTVQSMNNIPAPSRRWIPACSPKPIPYYVEKNQYLACLCPCPNLGILLAFDCPNNLTDPTKCRAVARRERRLPTSSSAVAIYGRRTIRSERRSAHENSDTGGFLKKPVSEHVGADVCNVLGCIVPVFQDRSIPR